MISAIPTITTACVCEGLVGDSAERDDKDLGRKHEVGADGPDLLFLVGDKIARSSATAASSA